MAKVKSLTVEFKGDASGVTRAARTARRAISGLARGARRAATGVAGIGTAIAGVAAGAGVIKLATDAAASVDKIGKLSKQLKVTTTDIQELSLVADLSGTSSEGLIKGFQRMSRVLGDAQRGSKAAGKVFAELGLNVEELSQLTPKLRFEKVIEGLRQIEDPARRASIANQLLGREWQKLNPLIDEGASAFAAATHVFRDLDLGLGGLNQGVEDMNDQMTILQATGIALRDNVFARLAPAIGQVVERVNDLVGAWIKANGGGQAVAQMLAGKIGSAVRSTIQWFADLADVVDTIVEGFRLMVRGLRFLGQLGGALAAAGVQAAQGNLSGAGAILSEDLGDVFDAANKPDEETRDNDRRQTDLLSQIVEELRGMQAGAAFQ